jgi:hypothetical protein
MSQIFCFGASMEIEDRTVNTELVVSDGRGRSYSDMVPRLARKYSVDAEALRGVHSKVRLFMAWPAEDPATGLVSLVIGAYAVCGS